MTNRDGLPLAPEDGWIFRIMHVSNVGAVLDRGVLCRNGAGKDTGYAAIGSPDLIDHRWHPPVPCPPGGELGDYVPFYFTPHSPMFFNIHTGKGVQKQANADIVILVTKLQRVIDHRCRVLFTDRAAHLEAAQYYDDLNYLVNLPWEAFRTRNFRKDPENPDHFERYRAEALIHRQLPVDALSAIACYTEEVRGLVKRQVDDRGLRLKVILRPRWYFS
ncbi:DUF4433 domain-containing protein [Tistrella bauzanensis]|uniref:type II toxin-antitoxin system toxin DNA ADP-ribosyl transferase DarT n=1 Tax=Tistrella TaxID=171436 RepID=UPI0031F6D48E